ncbi:MAG: Lipid-binding START domain-containing protein [uncultured Aureispira sp.]|uniref:Lipid-binding START domain-containing protein n=1 Tax=uncultured Aureispira sp. TaxID=1331704 RepID=A0A6S6UJ52_9BACT|nr:MAG: Lipid-binding START domain-containing protein [uncultured Aureispira sp.]
MHTIQYTFYALVFILGFSLISQTTTAQDWTVAKEKNGIKVETRFIDGWTVKEYRATTYIKTTLDEVVEAYRDPVKRKSFMARSLEVSNLKENSETDIITYNLIDAPWPVLDRDNITHSIFIKEGNQVKVTMESLPDFIPVKEDIVRIPRTKGHWLFVDQGNGLIKVVQQSVGDLGGSVPDWVINSTIVEGPYDVLVDLKAILE